MNFKTPVLKNVKFVILIFLLSYSFSVACQDGFYQLDSKITIRETPAKDPKFKLKKGEMLQILDFHDGYLHLKNNQYDGYFYYDLKRGSFKNKPAKDRINQLIFAANNNDMMKSKRVNIIPLGEVNTIIIPVVSESHDQYNTFGKYLVKSGFSFEQKDDSFLTLITNFKAIRDKNKDQCKYRLSVAFLDDRISIKIEYDDLNSVYYRDEIKFERYKTWHFDAGKFDNKYIDLIFWDIASILEEYNANVYYSLISGNS